MEMKQCDVLVVGSGGADVLQSARERAALGDPGPERRAARDAGVGPETLRRPGRVRARMHRRPLPGA